MSDWHEIGCLTEWLVVKSIVDFGNKCRIILTGLEDHLDLECGRDELEAKKAADMAL